jgi:hypothetical protein
VGSASGARTLIRFGALAAALSLSPISPLLLVLIPLGLMLVALRPDDVLALVVGIVLLGLAFLPAGGPRSTDWFAQRAWPMLLGAGFIGGTLVLGRATLLQRSLAAVSIAVLAVVAAGALRPTVVVGLDEWMTGQIQLAAIVLIQWSNAAGGRPEVAEPLTRAVMRWTDFQQQVYPALLALASLPALALGWYLFGRLTGKPETPAPVREFRFDDHLVWLFVAGLALFVLPVGPLLTRVGANAALFMAALYVVRGAAVITWLLRESGATPWTWLLLALAALLLYPMVLGAAFVFGIGDTWLDIRERIRSRRSPPVAR